MKCKTILQNTISSGQGSWFDLYLVPYQGVGAYGKINSNKKHIWAI